jgi:hypothetical protein
VHPGVHRPAAAAGLYRLWRLALVVSMNERFTAIALNLESKTPQCA